MTAKSQTMINSTLSCDAFAKNPASTTLGNKNQKLIKRKKIAAEVNIKDRLFLLNPNFTDERLEPRNQLYFCPFNAMLEGVIKYYPQLTEQLEITYIDFKRPRKTIVNMLGEENQGTPLLIITNLEVDITDIKTKHVNEFTFVSGAEDILNYLAKVYSIPLPHP